MYQYKMVQVPPNIEVKVKNTGTEAAAYLESIANQYAEQGWEFYRVDSVGVQIKPGCVESLFGKKADFSTYYVITFRKPR
jgi:hypothetical protein